LLDHSADANVQNEQYKTGLHLAAQNGYIQIVEVSMERCADPHAWTDKGETPFQVVSKRAEQKSGGCYWNA
jgi:ankyrin repeat protein